MSGTEAGTATLSSEEKRRRLAQLLQQKAAQPKTFPVTFSQRRLWFLDQLEPGLAVYNIPFPVKLNGEVEPAVVERAINEVVRRHESLRTVFRAVDGEPVQLVHAQREIPLTFHDLAGLEAGARIAEHRRLVEESQNRPFDLAEGPLVRATLMRMAPGDYLLLMCYHHIVGDGWSSAIFATEFLALYQAFSSGHPSPLPPLQIQYADYAAWQRDYLSGETLQAELDWWRAHLEGAPEVLELPTDRPRPPVQSYEGSVHIVPLPVFVVEGLNRLAREEGATPFMVLLAGFKSLLSRYSGQKDVVVGTPVAGRTRPEVEPLIGFFVNTLALRTDLSGDPTFRELVRRVRDVTLGAFQHQQMPFDKLVDDLGLERTLSHSPLVQVMFSLQNIGQEQVEAAAPEAVEGAVAMNQQKHDTGEGVSAEGVIVEAEQRASMFDITLQGMDFNGQFLLSLEYRTSLFDKETVFRMASHLVMLLEKVVAEPDRRLSRVSIVPRDERFIILNRWNRTEHELPAERLVHRMVAARAAAAPDAVALEWEGRRVTYAELDARASRLANHLRRRGVAAEARVGVCVERSDEMVVALLAILRAGGAYVPLDPEYPRERLALLAADSGARVLVTRAHLRGRVPEAGLEVVCLDSDRETIAAESAEDPGVEVHPASLAYLIYTSGSTGRPKGVMVPHGAIGHYVHAAALNYGVTAASRVLQFASASFDASAEEIWPALAYGGTVVLRTDEMLDSVPRFLERVGQWGITVLPLPTAYWHELAAQIADGGLRLPPSVQVVVIGGERVLPERVAAWLRAVGPQVGLVNTYGPTETTVVATALGAHTLPPEWLHREIPIGRPIPNYRAYVLDEAGQPQPVGIPGELYVGGPGVARGYRGHPALTAERFVPDPFAEEPGARLYRTGDLARTLPNGMLEFLGRTDAQVKVRGFRIELGEIEALLAEHPQVREAVVLARDAGPGDKRLVAYYTSPAPEPTDAGELRGFLKQRLPGYMVPSAFVGLPAFPLTPSGKLDRRALPAPDLSAGGDEEHVAPRDDAERVLAAIWRDVLGAREVGVRDNFFELGGDSILSLQIVSRAAQAGISLTPKLLFQHQTVEELAAVAGRGGRATAAEQGTVTGPVPLTPIQRWFFEQEVGERSHWNHVVALELARRVEPRVLEEAARALLAHHDALRLRFAREGEGWTSYNAGTEGALPFATLDLGHVEPADRPRAIEAALEPAQRSLDLGRGPLVRFVHLRLGEGAPDLLVVFAHHLVVDGVSWRVLIEDLEAACRAALGEGVRLPPKTTSFRAWAERLAGYARSGELAAEAEYWLGVASHDVPRLPRDFPEGEDTVAGAQKVAVAISPEETQVLLTEVPRALDGQINDALLAALAQAVAGWTGGRTVAIYQEGHGREDLFEDVDLSRTVGWFTSLFPVRLELPEGADPAGVVAAVKEQTRRMPNAGFGYGVLRYLAGGEVAERLAAAPEPEIAFNYLGQFGGGGGGGEGGPGLFRGAQVPTGAATSPQGRRSHPLEINGLVAGGTLSFEIEYGAGVFRRETIEALAASFAARLRELAAHVRGGGAGPLLAESFPEAELSQDELDALVAELGDV